MGEGKKVAKTYRLSEEILKELKEISSLLGISETEAISRAIHSFYLQLKGEEGYTVSGSIVPFSEYRKTQDQLKQALYKLGELEGRLKETENTIKAKEELIEELRNRIKELQAKPKRWWEFWK
ncbi:hypothetical protein JCM9492_13660 [Aquifex pyrophilus]